MLKLIVLLTLCIAFAWAVCPDTGANCQTNKNLCKNALYGPLMKRQCKGTCGINDCPQNSQPKSKPKPKAKPKSKAKPKRQEEETPTEEENPEEEPEDDDTNPPPDNPKPSPGPNQNCQDASQNCQAWKTNNFCNNAFYEEAVKKQYCQKSCNMC